MSPHFNMDDLDSLQMKINSKAPDLFKDRMGQAPLQVSRVFKGRIGKDEETSCFVRNQNVWNNSQIKALKIVRSSNLF
jgi:hypothetical protein